MGLARKLAWMGAAAAGWLAAGAGLAWGEGPGKGGPITRVERVGGVPTFTLDGTPFLLPCFETYAPEARYFQQFARAGTRLFTFNTNAGRCDYGHSAPTWVDVEQFDYRQLDARLSAVLSARPDALVLPRVYVGTPDWWLKTHPGELEVLDDGSTLFREPNRNPTLPKGRPFPSLVSARWRSDVARGLRRLVEHVQASDYAEHVFGYVITGLDTEEWYHWSSGSDQLAGYSRPTQEAFRAWLARKYGTVEALRRAWGRADVDFLSARVPSRQERTGENGRTFRDPIRQRNVIDFHCFYNEIVPDAIDHFAGVVKQATGGRKVVGGFYGYQYEFFGDPEYGHNALGRFCRAKNLDFMPVTASYYDRHLGTGADYPRSPVLSLQLSGKLWYHDNDTVSFLAPQVMKRTGMSEGSVRHYLSVLGATATAEETRWMYRRAAGFALGHGMFLSFFDLHGGYFDHPELMDEVAALNRLSASAGQFDRRPASEILVVADEASCSLASFRSKLLEASLRPVQTQLVKIGAPADHVLVDDLEQLDTSPYKLVIFLNAYQLGNARRKTIATKLLNGGRHVVWCYAPGYFNDAQSGDRWMHDLTGLRIVASPDERPVAPRIRLARSRLLPGLAEKTVGPEERCGKLFFVEDPAAEVLGRDPETSRATLAVKDLGGWTSYYAITPAMPAAVYRHLARAAGVHLFNDRDDTLYANRTYLALHADGPGLRTLRFPHPVDLFDALDGRPLAHNTVAYTSDFRHGETRIFRYGRALADKQPVPPGAGRLFP